jgi:hypothetical protein
LAEAKDKAGQATLGTLMVAVLDTASVLAVHGCLDGVQVALVPNNGTLQDNAAPPLQKNGNIMAWRKSWPVESLMPP